MTINFNSIFKLCFANSFNTSGMVFKIIFTLFSREHLQKMWSCLLPNFVNIEIFSVGPGITQISLYLKVLGFETWPVLVFFSLWLKLVKIDLSDFRLSVFTAQKPFWRLFCAISLFHRESKCFWITSVICKTHTTSLIVFLGFPFSFFRLKTLFGLNCLSLLFYWLSNSILCRFKTKRRLNFFKNQVVSVAKFYNLFARIFYDIFIALFVSGQIGVYHSCRLRCCSVNTLTQSLFNTVVVFFSIVFRKLLKCYACVVRNWCEVQLRLCVSIWASNSSLTIWQGIFCWKFGRF